MILNRQNIFKNSGEQPEFFVFKCILALVLLISCHNESLAQNLIPNAGFEEIFTRLEYQWVQPQGPYYHYESPDSAENFRAKGGRYVNGLCMYNFGENEFLHVRLLEPLVAGQEYILSVDAVLMAQKSFGAEFQKYIGIYFGNELLNTHIPGDLYFSPQVNLQLPDSNRAAWFTMVDTLKAAGGELFMTLGYFPETQSLEIKEMNQEAYWAQVEERYAARENKVNEDDKAWLYLPPDQQKKYLKEQKKKKKKSNQEVQSSRPTRVNGELPAIQRTENVMGEFAVRYYFDNFCLAPILADGSFICESSTPEEELVEGGTINLRNVFFETDKSELREESYIQLNALIGVLESFPEMKIEIRGYTDNVGGEAYNLNLSSRRAEAVVNWLITQGINSDRLSFKGFGEQDPVDSNDTIAGRARNRRVTFHILSM